MREFFLLVALVVVLVAAAYLLAGWRMRGVRGGGDGAGDGASDGADDGAGDGKAVIWPNLESCTPKACVAEARTFIRSLFRESRSFAPEPPRAALVRESARLESKYGVPFGVDRLRCMWRMELALEVRSGAFRALRLSSQIAAMRKRGRTPLEISAALRVPPVAVLRRLLLELGHSEQAVRAMIERPETMPADLARDAPAAIAADIGSRSASKEIQLRAEQFERQVGEQLRALGVRFKTEAELRAAGETLTPDFLLDSPARFRVGSRLSAPLRWVDAKDFGSWDNRLVAKKMAAQAEKYNARFGPGAFVFSGGVMCGALPAGPLHLVCCAGAARGQLPARASPSSEPRAQDRAAASAAGAATPGKCR
jgi:hypothetical protein